MLATRRLTRARAARAVAVLLVGLLLAGCIDRGDALAPMVTITDPRSGATSATTGLRIVGYAMDDEGIRSIRVDGQDLLADPIYAGERGKRLIEFAFTGQNLTDGEVEHLIEVEGVGGRVTRYPYRLRLDNTPPTLELIAVTGIGGGRLRVEGVARDNTLVTSVRINDVPLQFTPAPEFAFRVDVADVEGGQIVVEDAAGNETRRDLR